MHFPLFPFSTAMPKMSSRVAPAAEDDEAEPAPTCPICMEPLECDRSVTLCPRPERPCAARYHEACAELHRKHGEGRNGAQCPTCRAKLPTAPVGIRRIPTTATPAPPSSRHYLGDCAGFVLCYCMACALVVMLYFLSGLLVGIVVRLLYGEPEGVDLQRHRVYLNRTTSFDVRLEDIANDERRWATMTRRLQIDRTTHVRATGDDNGVFELDGEAPFFHDDSSQDTIFDVFRVEIAASSSPQRVLEVRHLLETPYFATDPLSAAFFDQSAWGILWGVFLWGWKRLLDRNFSDADDD